MTSTILPRSDVSGLKAISVGDGRPVVLLHGVGLQADAWRPQIEALRQTNSVVAPDMPGHGQSPCPSGPLALGDYTDAFLPIFDGFKEPAVVIGHSMGAMIALDLAFRAPSKVHGVVALNGVFERPSQAAVAVRARADSLDGATVPDPEPTLFRWFGETHSLERKACETWLRAADPAGYKRAYTAFAKSDGPSRQALAAMACPALFATGALEPNSTPDMSHEMAAITPRGRALIVDGAAHMMPMTHARQVNAALTEFLQEIWP